MISPTYRGFILVIHLVSYKENVFPGYFQVVISAPEGLCLIRSSWKCTDGFTPDNMTLGRALGHG